MIPDQVKADDQRATLRGVASAALLSAGVQKEDIEVLAATALDAACEITPPDLAGLDSAGLVLMKPGGHEATTVKFGNVSVDFRKLSGFMAAGALTVVGITTPWLLFVAGIALWNQIYAHLEIQISESVAVVLWSMWISRDPATNRVEDKTLLATVNAGLSGLGRPPIGPEECERCTTVLRELKCIELDGSQWWLREKVRVEF